MVIFVEYMVARRWELTPAGGCSSKSEGTRVRERLFLLQHRLVARWGRQDRCAWSGATGLGSCEQQTHADQNVIGHVRAPRNILSHPWTFSRGGRRPMKPSNIFSSWASCTLCWGFTT